MADDRSDEAATGAAAGGADDGGAADGGAADGGALASAPWAREALRCPGCGSPLRDGRRPDGAPELVCTGERCALAYPVRDGIPVLLVDEARKPA